LIPGAYKDAVRELPAASNDATKRGSPETRRWTESDPETEDIERAQWSQGVGDAGTQVSEDSEASASNGSLSVQPETEVANLPHSSESEARVLAHPQESIIDS
jgi:hypothetical protein